MIKLCNSLSRKKEPLKPRKNGALNLFVCGLTVYDFSHVGHARTYVVFDMVVKYLRQKKYKVFYLQNITDVDDKIIQRARELKQNPKDLAREFEKEYLWNMKALGVNSVSKYARATEHIKEIISQIKRLLAAGYAYETTDGIYYDILKFKDYGKLSHRTTLQAEDAVSRIDESVKKKHKGDFALWKFSPPEDSQAYGQDEPRWPSPWGKGRPGWHIEDTAITEKYFGSQYDIHGGARDLMFPHHEAEIAQMEAVSGKKPMVNYWLHTGFLTVSGEKMSKSLGNFITIRDFLRTHSPRVLRLMVLKSHYRSPIDYSENAIRQTEQELRRLDEFTEKLERNKLRKDGVQANLMKIQIAKTKGAFDAAMEDDFNTPKALAAIFALVHRGNSLLAKNEMRTAAAKEMREFLAETDGFLQFIFWGKQRKEKIPEEILRLAKERGKYRRRKDWQKADEIRKQISVLGYRIEDTAGGHEIKKI